MANFQNAFKQGLRASADADVARKEIYAVLNEFARQVAEASQDAIKIKRATVRRPIKAKRTIYDLATGGLRDYKTVRVINAHAAGSSRSQELCEYELSPSGYPIELRYDHVVEECRSKKSLEDGLESLLAAPQTGDKLRRLLEEPASAPPEPSPGL